MIRLPTSLFLYSQGFRVILTRWVHVSPVENHGSGRINPTLRRHPNIWDYENFHIDPFLGAIYTHQYSVLS